MIGSRWVHAREGFWERGREREGDARGRDASGEVSVGGFYFSLRFSFSGHSVPSWEYREGEGKRERGRVGSVIGLDH